VILKPMAISETHSIPICLILNTPQPEGFVLQQGGRANHGEPVTSGPRDVLLEFAQLAHDKWKGAYYRL
jgi:hypothetical protein